MVASRLRACLRVNTRWWPGMKAGPTEQRRRCKSLCLPAVRLALTLPLALAPSCADNPARFRCYRRSSSQCWADTEHDCGLRIANCGFEKALWSAVGFSKIRNPKFAIRNLYVQGCSSLRSAGGLRDLLSHYRGRERHQPRRWVGDIGLAFVERPVLSQNGGQSVLGAWPSISGHVRRAADHRARNPAAASRETRVD